MICLTAAQMRKTASFGERKFGFGPHDTEEVCPVDTVIVMTYLITG